MTDYEEYLFEQDHGRVIIAFAGGPMNVFQWHRTLTRLGRSHVLFRDARQVYYQLGIRGIGDVLETCTYLRTLRDRYELTTIGVSSGAFGALLYAQLVPAHKCIVFSAITTRVEHPEGIDPQWHHSIYDPAMPPSTELLDDYKLGPKSRVTAYVSDGPGTHIDYPMIARLHPQQIVIVPGFSHGDLARGMRDKGLLDEVFK